LCQPLKRRPIPQAHLTFVQRYDPAPARPFKRHTVHGLRGGSCRVNNGTIWQRMCELLSEEVLYKLVVNNLFPPRGPTATPAHSTASVRPAPPNAIVLRYTLNWLSQTNENGSSRERGKHVLRPSNHERPGAGEVGAGRTLSSPSTDSLAHLPWYQIGRAPAFPKAWKFCSAWVAIFGRACSADPPFPPLCPSTNGQKSGRLPLDAALRHRLRMKGELAAVRSLGTERTGRRQGQKD